MIKYIPSYKDKDIRDVKEEVLDSIKDNGYRYSQSYYEVLIEKYKEQKEKFGE